MDAFVGRLLRDDIPGRFELGRCQMWVYQDSESHLVGFGTLDLSLDCAEYTAGQPHTYIPPLAVNQSSEGRGYGQFIVRHLVAEATLQALAGLCPSGVYLDVYTASQAAIHIYRKCGFVDVTSTPLVDPMQSDQAYHIMANRATPISRGLSLFVQGPD